jgi:hypothetical protein
VGEKRRFRYQLAEFGDQREQMIAYPDNVPLAFRVEEEE